MDTAVWKTAISRLRDHLPPLAPQSVWDPELDLRIGAYRTQTTDREERSYELAVKSGLHLWNGNLDASHTISQDLEHSTGSYWHGIMHRMEGDYGNAKYWFRRVGDHPVFPQLLEETKRLVAGVEDATSSEAIGRLCGQDLWDPYLFIDLVEQEVRSGGLTIRKLRLLQEIQRAEMALLLKASASRCGGGNIFDDILG